MSTIATPPATLRDALPELRRPFTPDAVKWKVQSASKDGSGAGVVAYIDARLVIDRLNHVVAGDWEDDYFPVDGGMLCVLKVCGVIRRDVGTMESGSAGGVKGLYSDALKRAAVKFGIGASIYALPSAYLRGDSLKRRQDGKIVGIQPGALENLKRNYANWLPKVEHLFGEPLDHGDVGVEYEAEQAGEHEPPAARPAPRTLTPRPAQQKEESPTPAAAATADQGEGGAVDADPEAAHSPASPVSSPAVKPFDVDQACLDWVAALKGEEPKLLKSLLVQAGLLKADAQINKRQMAKLLVDSIGDAAASFETTNAALDKLIGTSDQRETVPVNDAVSDLVAQGGPAQGELA